MADPRLYQIGTLAALLIYGIAWHTKLFNQASQIVLVGDGDRTVMTW